ncbi:MAG: AAA family ATPase [Anaerolineales bacterium]|nr:AAA family ATPase [Anaerolineales bacterium]
MRFQTVEIENYRAISSVKLENLGDMVIIAGPNGCGKSCVFDAIRLLKSVYGGYQPNEWHQFFGEFQIQIGQKPEELLTIFQDKTKPLKISAEIIISNEEKQYLLNEGMNLLRDQIWKEIAPELAGWKYIGISPLATQHRIHAADVESRTILEWGPLREELRNNKTHWGTVNISTTGQASATPSPILELIFSIYDPQNIGIVDYHGATRNYAREQVGGINLNIEPAQDKMRQHALYNYANKYANLKTQMASGYVRNLLVSQTGGQVSANDNLTETLKELFQTFFPGKEFLGPQPTNDGRLLFPVRTRNGSTHDIDELSSGEKEVLYGYLRLRNTAPKNSVVLIDEPELHLNPRLIHGLAGFYHRNLGKLLGNQIWLVTHSDTLIREAVGHENFSVFHMQPPDLLDGKSQVSEVKVAEDIERIVIELVGDLAAYRPEAKIVIFEGGGDSQFDVWMVNTLFPRFSTAVNSISGGNKVRVQNLYELLEQTRIEAQVPARFFAITDRDSEIKTNDQKNTYNWDVYHIENYLLEPDYILRVINDVRATKTNLRNLKDVEIALHACAEETVNGLIERQIRYFINGRLLKALDLGIDPNSKNISEAFQDAIERSKQKFIEISTDFIKSKSVEVFEQKIRDEVKESLASDKWKAELRGRDILKRFVSQHGNGMRYEQMRDLIVARMKDDQFEPTGMKKILEKIIDNVSVHKSDP